MYFGFTDAVKSFSVDQISGLRTVPINCVLLETDSPYMKPSGKDVKISIPGAFFRDVFFIGLS